MSSEASPSILTTCGSKLPAARTVSIIPTRDSNSCWNACQKLERNVWNECDGQYVIIIIIIIIDLNSKTNHRCTLLYIVSNDTFVRF